MGVSCCCGKHNSTIKALSTQPIFGEGIENSAFCERVGYDWGRALAQINLGWVALAEGDAQEAQQFFMRSLSLCEPIDNFWGVASGARIVHCRKSQMFVGLPKSTPFSKSRCSVSIERIPSQAGNFCLIKTNRITG